MKNTIIKFYFRNKKIITILYIIIFGLTLILQFTGIFWISYIREFSSFLMLLIALIQQKTFIQKNQYGGIFNVGREYGRFLFNFINNISNITNDKKYNTSISTNNKICKYYSDAELFFNPHFDIYILKENCIELQIKLNDFNKYKSLLVKDKIIEEKNNKPENVEFIYELNPIKIYEYVKIISIIDYFIKN